MRFISKKFSESDFDFLELLTIEGKIQKIYLASAYCDTDILYKIKNSIKDQIDARGCEFHIFIDQFANKAWLGQELISKFRGLTTRLKNEISPTSEIYFVKNSGKLFHSKILYIKTTKYIKIYLGSMNFTERGTNPNENEEILCEFEKTITTTNKFISEIENYFIKLQKNSLALSELKKLPTINKYSSARDFFLSGHVFFEFANIRLFNFPLELPEEVKKGVSKLHNSLIDITQDNIDIIKKVCSFEKNNNHTSWKQYTIETPYGYWAPKEFLEKINKILDEKSSYKANSIRIIKELTNENEVNKIMLPYFQEISENIYQKFPDCEWDAEKLKTRWTNWYNKLLKKINNNAEGEFNLILEKYISGISWCSLPDFWDDTYLRENFEDYFLNSLAIKTSIKSSKKNCFIKFLNDNYKKSSFDDFNDFTKIITDKNFSKKMNEFIKKNNPKK